MFWEDEEAKPKLDKYEKLSRLIHMNDAKDIKSMTKDDYDWDADKEYQSKKESYKQRIKDGE